MSEEKELTEEQVKAFQVDLDAIQKKHGLTCMASLQYAPGSITPMLRVVKTPKPSPIITPA
jgi:hypothetical protein